jgi:hypothetical protein
MTIDTKLSIEGGPHSPVTSSSSSSILSDTHEHIASQNRTDEKKTISTAPAGEAKLPVEDADDKDTDHDLEQLARTSSGPVYSVFTKKQKHWIMFMCALGGFFSPLSSSIYFPALPALASDLKVTTERINLTVTAFLIFQGILPATFGDMADMIGRRPCYLICLFGYVIANIGLALQTNYAALFVLRCIQAIASPTIALGSGVVSDIVTPAERGAYMSYVQCGK